MSRAGTAGEHDPGSASAVARWTARHASALGRSAQLESRPARCGPRGGIPAHGPPRGPLCGPAPRPTPQRERDGERVKTGAAADPPNRGRATAGGPLAGKGLGRGSGGGREVARRHGAAQGDKEAARRRPDELQRYLGRVGEFADAEGRHW